MNSLKTSLIAKTQGKAKDNQIYYTDNLRITVLTPRLIRVESRNTVTDLPTQTVWFRSFETDKASVSANGSETTVETTEAVFKIKGDKPVSVHLKNENKELRFSKQKNLKGTYRTLDNTVGKIPLSDGLITKDGAYLYDDGQSLLLDEGGHLAMRKNKTHDYYAFAYGKNYRETIRAFYMISSAVPLIPRYALGVWWSRYHAYTQQEYLDLIAEFKKREIPLTVATIDMDWHWVKKEDIKGKLGANYSGCGTYGWTGYSWNKTLFPDYKEFLKKLKADNLHITLNLHPADGVHSYEDMYEDMAKAVGVDPKTKQKIKFSCADDNFWNAYFDILHKPYEKDGVDFWWIDWQQGKKSDVNGLDPLYALNHYHFLDNAEDGTLPLILSRYAGLGSHRYPLGFSGDTSITWRVLDFQPYFTANAANCAYTWWSHDIGGHHQGYRDDELYLRWIEFGVFSPILRLHSTAIDFLGKEPWKYRADVYESAKKWLCFRHRLIPYIYTMDYVNHKDGTALCEPMYYSYPENENAFNVPNQYMFGSELMVCPITKKASKKTFFASVKAWIPQGTYTDIFTLQKYEGEQIIELCREIYNIPVLAKAGAIIPLSDDEGNCCSNPQRLEIWVFKGNGSFTLYEDSSKTDYEDNNVKTELINKQNGDAIEFTIKKPVGNTELIPENRHYKIVFKDASSSDVSVSCDANIAKTKDGGVTAECDFADDDIVITLNNIMPVQKPSYKERVINIISRWNTTTAKKQIAYRKLEGKETKEEISSALRSSRLPKDIKLLIEEMLKEL